jgi:antitoxin ParD1/3/4
MQVVLTPQLEAFVKAQVNAGHYSSEDEVLREAVRLLLRREQLFEEKLQRLREALIAGEESGPAEEFTFEQLMAELDAEEERR